MTTNIKQVECDLLVETISKDWFGSPKVPKWIDVVLRNRGFNLKEKVDIFDSFIQEFMNDDGTVRGNFLRELVQEEYPRLALLIPDGNFRLVDQYNEYAKVINILLKGGTNARPSPAP